MENLPILKKTELTLFLRGKRIRGTKGATGRSFLASFQTKIYVIFIQKVIIIF